MNIGPLGPQFSTVGSETYNVYLPQLSPEYPPIHGFPTMFGSVSEYIKMFLAGLPVGSTALESVLSDEVVSRFLLMSVAELEKAMGVFIVPRVIKANATMRGFRFAQDFDVEEREIDYDAQEWFNWGYMQLRHKPIMSIQRISLVYPTGQEIMEIPIPWIKPVPLKGQIRLVPIQGTLSEIMLGPGGMYLPLLANGLLRDMPALIWIDYMAGMNPIPYDLVEVIGKNAAIKILHALSDALEPGIVSKSSKAVDLEETYTLARSIGGQELFGARIAVYTKEVTDYVGTAKRYYGGIVYRTI